MVEDGGEGARGRLWGSVASGVGGAHTAGGISLGLLEREPFDRAQLPLSQSTSHCRGKQHPLSPETSGSSP